jgi:hypothetical protein
MSDYSSHWRVSASSYASRGDYASASLCRSYAESAESSRRLEEQTRASWERDAERRSRESRERESRENDERATRSRELDLDSAQAGSECMSQCVAFTLEALITNRPSFGEVVVKTDAMFAKTVLGMSDSSGLCPFLQEMDRAEAQIQEGEQREIQEKRVGIKAGLNATVAVEVSAFFGFSSLMLFNFPLLSAAVAALAGGAAAAISDSTDAFGQATQYAEKAVNVYGKRVTRLARKVDAITREMTVPGKEEGELSQLRRVERAFSGTISQYRDWEESGRLPCCC